MTPLQRATYDARVKEGFKLVVESGDIVRVTRHGDNRVIYKDGSQKRGHHVAPGQLKTRGRACS